jgi:hypothetical protein
MTEEEKEEWLVCAESPIYFIHNYCFVEDATIGEWIPFRLWPAQAKTLRTLFNNLLVVILKARQLGMTWLVLAFALWLMLFHPIATVLLFSRRDDEAIVLLRDRLKGMYSRLPDWMKVRKVVIDNDHEWQLSNGSVARAFPTTAGDSYNATLAIVDEADLIPDLNRLMRAVKPTIDGGGRMILLSRSDKTKPQSEFKAIYRTAKQKLNSWAAVFLPWWARPERDASWYEEQKRDSLSRTSSLDDLHEQYPASDTEALAPRTLDKRIPSGWLEQCYKETQPHLPAKAPAIPGLEIFKAPVAGRRYVIGVDPAEGNPTSDDSALEVQDRETGEQMACLAGKYQPAVMAANTDLVGKYYNQADLLVERNNHGHAVILWLFEHSSLRVLDGYDGKPGWLSSALGKTMLYDACADAFREQGTLLHSFMTYTQLASIEGATLRAPEGEHDDRADANALANIARQYSLIADRDKSDQVVVYDERVNISDY